eukprot:gene16843-34973_t
MQTQIQARSKTRQGVIDWAGNTTHIARTEGKTTAGITTPRQPKIYLVQTSMFRYLDGSGAKPPMTEDDTVAGSEDDT